MNHASEICNCPCHTPGNYIVHMFPCCQMCPNCGQGIRQDLFKQHTASCPPISQTPWTSGWLGLSIQAKAPKTLRSCFVRFCRSRNFWMFPIVGFAGYTATLQILIAPWLTLLGIVLGLLAYRALERHFHVQMHNSRRSPFYRSHGRHHENPTPETGCPEHWLLVVYAAVNPLLLWAQLPITTGIWFSIIFALLVYEWVHFLCHCNYRPKTKLGWKIRTNHLKHHNFDDTQFYEMLFPKTKDTDR